MTKIRTLDTLRNVFRVWHSPSKCVIFLAEKYSNVYLLLSDGFGENIPWNICISDNSDSENIWRKRSSDSYNGSVQLFFS